MIGASVDETHQHSAGWMSAFRRDYEFRSDLRADYEVRSFRTVQDWATMLHETPLPVDRSADAE